MENTILMKDENWKMFLERNKQQMSRILNAPVLKAAVGYRAKNLSVIATTIEKKPIGPWKEEQSVIPSDQKLIDTFTKHTTSAIGLVCGRVSGNLEVIDLDLKYDISGSLLTRFKNAIDEALPGLFERLYSTSTQTRGYHFYYPVGGAEEPKISNAIYN